VRAYPQGEASGDTGILLNLEARYNLSGIEFGTVQVVGFMDVGSITQHQSVWNGWQPTGRPDFPNTYSLSGAGLGLNLYRGEGFSLRTAVAWKLGGNPGADIQGRDSDGSDRSPRFWLQASMQF
jgi:hemolysin activation/secretion protein